ncbi:hypothetical protein [Duganella qianjiadongensis]|uniref:DUF2069 domain-containing protein n=1 Tax=Duganella qianjiadongensis TaxID=2692176 RepID=A0ABW9VHZ7_9BURK|nr:hypothetical protein [Duganella qianjiadongensis]MYM39246.1 hypothetical protein [Duganella qianjiadongensis]
MPEVSTLRLYLLRAVYLIITVGLAMVIWPGVLHHEKPWSLPTGVVQCMLAAFSLLCALGLRYPLQMLPVLMWELLWKALWMLVVALPAWRSGQIDPATLGTLYECAFVIIIPLAMPWRYVYARYLQQPGDRWRPLRGK